MDGRDSRSRFPICTIYAHRGQSAGARTPLYGLPIASPHDRIALLMLQSGAPRQARGNAVDDEQRAEYLKLDGVPLCGRLTNAGKVCDHPAGPRGLSFSAWAHCHRRLACRYHREKPAAQGLSADSNDARSLL